MFEGYASEGSSENHITAFRKKFIKVDLTGSKPGTYVFSQCIRLLLQYLPFTETNKASRKKKEEDVLARETSKQTCTGWQNGERTRLLTCGLPNK